ncbi:MAG: GDSL-type esterase/lipase family protein, partial [Bryobacteraceae bacterium]
MGDSTVVGGSRAFTVSGSAMTGNMYTVSVVASLHGIVPGSRIFCGGANDTRFLGSHTAVAVPTANQFTFEVQQSFGAIDVSDTASAVQFIIDDTNTDRGAFPYANAAIGSPYAIRNRSVSGSKTSRHLARFEQDVLSLDPSLVYYMGFTNDIRGNVTSDDIIANINSICEKSLARGVPIILCTSTPYDARGVSYTSEKLDRYNIVNAWIRRYASQTNGVLCHDVYAATVDFSSATGNWLADYSNVDYIHPSRFGMQRAGKTLIPILQRIAPGRTPRGIQSARDDHWITNASMQFCRNAVMVGTSGTKIGTVSGSVPTHWIVNNYSGSACEASIEADSDGYGNALVLTLGGGGTSNIDVLAYEAAAFVTPGEVYQLSYRLRGSGIGSVVGIAGFIQGNNGGSFSHGAPLFAADITTKSWQDDFDLYLVGEPVTVPAGTYILYRPTWRIYCNNSTGIVKLSQVSFRRIS